jgi:hypothetical protein
VLVYSIELIRACTRILHRANTGMDPTSSLDPWRLLIMHLSGLTHPSSRVHILTRREYRLCGDALRTNNSRIHECSVLRRQAVYNRLTGSFTHIRSLLLDSLSDSSSVRCCSMQVGELLLFPQMSHMDLARLRPWWCASSERRGPLQFVSLRIAPS